MSRAGRWKRRYPAWVSFVARRYFFIKRKEKGHIASVLSISGIAIGVMTLIAVISIMNGFQQGYITSILEIGSYHVRIQSDETAVYPALLEELRALPGVKSAVPFMKNQTIIQGNYTNQEGVLLHGLPDNVWDEDSDFRDKLELVDGEYNISGERDIVLGTALARKLGVTPGDSVTLLFLTGEAYEKLKPIQVIFRVTGLVSCGYYEYDTTMGFINLTTAIALSGRDEVAYGLKLANHFRDRAAVRRIRELNLNEDWGITSWRQDNRALFSALKVEKMVMMIVVGLIFIVVAVNIFHSMRRSVQERMSDIALLKAVGANKGHLRSIYLFEGVLIGLIGSLAGLGLGLLVSYHVNELLDFFTRVGQFFASFFSSGKNDITLTASMSIFNSAIPVEVMGSDVAFILGMSFLSCLFAAYFASRRIIRFHPSEIMRYE